MKVSRISLENFADGEAPTVVNDNVAGEDLVIRGGNRSGKTLTFNALIYGLLGRDATFGVSPGYSSEISLTFDNGDKLERKSAGRIYVHDGQRGKGDEADEKVDELIGPREILRLQFIHSETTHLPLSELSNEDRLSVIRRVTKSGIEEEINRLEERRQELESEIEQVERLKHRPKKESLEELEPEIVANRLSKFRELKHLIDSSQLETIRDTLLENQQTREELEALDKERRSLQKELRRKRRQFSDTKRYDEEVDQLILDAIRELTCPVCDHIVREDLAERRLSRDRCPQCGQEGLISDVRENLEQKVQTSDEAIEEIEEEIAELEEERDRIESQIADIRESKIELSNLNSTAVFALRQQDYDTDAVAVETEEQIKKLENQLEEQRQKQSELEGDIDDAKSRLDELHEERTTTIEQKEALEQRSFEKEISEFTEAWSENYQDMAPSLAAEVEIRQIGEVILPGVDGIRQYNHLSTGEMRLLNLAFALTLAEHAQENGAITHDWDCLVLDEPFANIDEDIQEESIGFLKSSDFQFILTTSSEGVVRRFDTDQIKELERIPIQTTIQESLENE